MIRRFPLVIALLGITLPSTAETQAIITLDGLVRNDRGGIAHAQVFAIDSLTNERRAAVTNERGFFRLLDLSPGRYALSARVIGHQPVTQTIQLVAGQRAQIEVVMQRAATTLETVQVQEQRTETAEIQRMSVSTAVTEKEIQRLPLNTRNVMELAAVAPGIRSFQAVSGNAIPAAGSIRNERGLNLYLDGLEMKNLNSTNVVGSPQTGSPLPIDGLQELRVFLHPYDAEYTRGVAYIISAVTHRGTNERHGSVFGFFQNKDLVSVTDFQRSIPNFEKPDFKRNQAGFSLRGPFVRDRLFYALSYERSDTENYISVVPGRPASDPAMWDRYAGVFSAPNRNQTGLLRLTYAANEGSTVEGIWSTRYLTGESFFGGRVPRESAVKQEYRVNTVNLRHRWLPRSGFANELSLQFLSWDHEHKPLVLGPEFRYPTISLGRADGFGEIHESQFRVIERVTYSAGSGPGSHLVKAGLEIARVYQHQFTPVNGQGLFRFRSETAPPHEALIAVGFTDPHTIRDASAILNGWVTGAYVNDEWHLGSRLVLNLGLRYDAEINTMNNDFTVPWVGDTSLAARPELKGLLNRGNRKDDLDNLSPRISFAWDVGGNRRTSIRGGFGIMYDRVPGFVPMNEQRNSNWRTYQFSNPGTTSADELRQRVIAGSGTAVPPAMSLLPRKMNVPQNRQVSLGAGAQLTRALAVNIDFVDQDLRKLYAPMNLNWLDLSRTSDQRVLSQAYGNIIAWGDFARGRYRAMLTSVTYKPDTALRLNLAHTLASAKAEWDVETLQVPAEHAGTYYVMDRISGDERHRFVLSGTWLARYGVGVSTIMTAASPRPYLTSTGQDDNKNNTLEDDWIDGRRYQVPANDWSNWYRVVDLRLTKTIGVRRATRIVVTAEAFNLLNTENYSGYFGVQRSATGEFRPDFGSPSGVFASRQFQLGTRLSF